MRAVALYACTIGVSRSLPSVVPSARTLLNTSAAMAGSVVVPSTPYRRVTSAASAVFRPCVSGLATLFSASSTALRVTAVARSSTFRRVVSRKASRAFCAGVKLAAFTSGV